MALFQRSVLDKYLKQQDGAHGLWLPSLQGPFHDAAIQAHIRESKGFGPPTLSKARGDLGANGK